MEMTNTLIQLVYALLIAVVYGIASYLKDSNLEEFSVPMFVKTLMIGLLVGVAMYYSGMTYENALQFIATNAFLMTFIDKIINGIFKMKAKLKSSTSVRTY